MKWQDRIVVDPKLLVGKPVIKDTRIAVEFVVDLLGRGWTTDQILEEYDHLTADDIQACLAYASDVLKSERVYLMPIMQRFDRGRVPADDISDGYAVGEPVPVSEIYRRTRF